MTPNKVLLLFVTAALALGSCKQPANDVSDVNTVEPEAEESAAGLPVAEPAMDRAALLLAAAKAGSAAALGQDDSEAQRELRGDSFETRIRFGCPIDNMQASNGPFGLGFDEQSRTLRVRARPDITESDVWVKEAGGETVEAVEGFRMNRPWLLTAACPPVAGSPQVPPPSVPVRTPQHWVGIAQFFTEADSRTRRRDHRPYEATKALAEGMVPSKAGYDLVLSGRLRALPGGRVIACKAGDPARPADCVISVTFDKVRIERADSREMLAEWSPG